MKKAVIIINGRGAVGKDTLCDMASKYYSVDNVSSITPIKDIAKICGWKGEKDNKSRQFLSDLKRLLTDYNEYPTSCLIKQYNEFKENDKQIMFVHIREGVEIDKFKHNVDIPCFTLLIKRSSQEFNGWGNTSDDDVEDYTYDYTFDNCKTLEEAEVEFNRFIHDIIKGID